MLPQLRERRSFFEPFESLRSEIERLFDRFPTATGGAGASFASAPVDLWEDDEHVHVEADLPGFRKNDIHVSIQEGVLTIEAERKEEKKEREKKGTPHLTERRSVRVQRRLLLPSTVDEEQVEARYVDGVLKLKMNKSPEPTRRRIEIG